MSESEEISEATESSTALTEPPGDNKDQLTDQIIKSHTIWAFCAGAVPFPLADIAAVTAIQMDALKQLATANEIDYSGANGKRFVTALTGSAFARIGASMIKVIPGVGTLLGGISMMALSGASTWAVCHVAVNHFKKHGNFLELDLDVAKEAYQEAFEKGKEVVESFKGKEEEARQIYDDIAKLEELRDSGSLTEEELEAKKAELLAKL